MRIDEVENRMEFKNQTFESIKPESKKLKNPFKENTSEHGEIIKFRFSERSYKRIT